jgi:hypothetical protein
MPKKQLFLQSRPILERKGSERSQRNYENLHLPHC